MLYRVTLKRVRDQVSERRTSTLLKIYKQSLKDLHSVTAAFFELFFISSRFNYEFTSALFNQEYKYLGCMCYCSRVQSHFLEFFFFH